MEGKRMGRPPLSRDGQKVRRMSISLPPRLVELFKQIGGSAWLRAELEKIERIKSR